MLPNFLVLGAAKSGTTALHRYLEAHPDIFVCPRKDTNFLAWEPGADAPADGESIPPEFPVREIEAYEALFAGAEGRKAVGEISTYYLESPRAPGRIRALLPGARLVAMLRDPVDRAYSGYVMRFRMGRETRAVADALHPDSHYVRTGRYATFLERFRACFPAEQMHVMAFEEFRSDPQRRFAELLDFLGVDAAVRVDLSTRHNVGGLPRSRLLHRLYTNAAIRGAVLPLLPAALRRLGTRLRNRNMAPAPPLPPAVRARLREHYRDEVARLDALLGRDFGALWQR